MKIRLWSLSVLLSLLLHIFVGCDSEVDAEDYGDDICTGSCQYCPDQDGYRCTGVTGTSENTDCHYCKNGQACNSEYNICQ